MRVTVSSLIHSKVSLRLLRVEVFMAGFASRNTS